MNWEVANAHLCTLGEGPVWDEQHQRLLWVDIAQGDIHQLDPDTGHHAVYQTGHTIGAIVLKEFGSLLAATKDGFFEIELKSQTQTFICDPEQHLPGNRFNDGKCDPAGRFWAGTMSVTNEPKAGKLYCLEKDFSVSVKLEDVGCSNGLAWSPDHSVFYYIDSLAENVVAYNHDPLTGAIANRRVVVKIPRQTGIADGMSIDSEGMLWIAIWGGASIIRVNPINGTILYRMNLPVSQITSCTFGGKNLQDLYITTAKIGLTDSKLRDEPLAGALLVCKNTPYRGLAPNLFLTKCINPSRC